MRWKTTQALGLKGAEEPLIRSRGSLDPDGITKFSSGALS